MADERYILIRPPQLPELTEVGAGAYVVGYDSATDRTVKINVSALGGGQETDINWRANVPYATGLIVEYGLKLWKSLIDDNLGNLPSEGANWTEVSKAGAGSNITNYTTGVYTYDPTIVLREGRIYYLLAAKPFESTDFIAELEATQWREINRNNIIGVAYNNLIGSDYYFPNLDDTLIVLTAGTIGIENGNGTVFSLTITEPSYVIRTGTGYTAGDFTILPIFGGGSGGHVIQNAAGTYMPTQPALQFGTGFTVTDETGKTVVGNTAASHIDGADEEKHTFNQIAITENKVLLGGESGRGTEGDTVDVYDISAANKSFLETENNWIVLGEPVANINTGFGLQGNRYSTVNWSYECYADGFWLRTPTGVAYLDVYNAVTATAKTLIENTSNWTAKVYTGAAITDVKKGTRHYNDDYFFEFVDDNLPIRVLRS